MYTQDLCEIVTDYQILLLQIFETDSEEIHFLVRYYSTSQCINITTFITIVLWDSDHIDVYVIQHFSLKMYSQSCYCSEVNWKVPSFLAMRLYVGTLSACQRHRFRTNFFFSIRRIYSSKTCKMGVDWNQPLHQRKVLRLAQGEVKANFDNFIPTLCCYLLWQWPHGQCRERKENSLVQ